MTFPSDWWLYFTLFIIAIPFAWWWLHRWRVRRNRSLAKLYGVAFHMSIRGPRENVRRGA